MATFVIDNHPVDSYGESTSMPTKIRRFQAFKERYVAFRFVLRVATLIGIPLPLESLESEAYEPSRAFMSYCFSLTALRALLLVVCTVCLKFTFPSTTARATHIVYSLVGFANAAYCCARRRDIAGTLRRMCRLATDLGGPATSVGKRAVKVRVAIAAAVFACFTGIGINFFFFQDWEEASAALPAYFPRDSGSHHAFVWAVQFAVLGSYQAGMATTYLLLVLCDDAYNALSKILVLYAKRIREDFQHQRSRAAVLDHIGQFRKVKDLIREADGALGAIAFLVYSALVTNFFQAAGVFLSRQSKFASPPLVAFSFFTIACAFVAFAVLTLSGASVQDRDLDLRRVLEEVSGAVVKDSKDVATVVSFRVLLGDVKSTKIRVTGMGLFRVTRGFFLTIAGTVVTYGILIYQIGAIQ